MGDRQDVFIKLSWGETNTPLFCLESCGLNQNLSGVMRIFKNHVLKIRIFRAKTISVKECVLEFRTSFCSSVLVIGAFDQISIIVL